MSSPFKDLTVEEAIEEINKQGINVRVWVQVTEEEGKYFNISKVQARAHLANFRDDHEELEGLEPKIDKRGETVHIG